MCQAIQSATKIKKNQKKVKKGVDLLYDVWYIIDER